MRNYLFRLILPLFAVVLLPACGGDDDEPTPAPEPPNPVSRTVLVYMVADNTLGSWSQSDEQDIQEMLAGVKNGALNGGRLLVYHNRPKTASNPPQMLEITEQGLKVLKNYPNDPSVYSVDPERITEVMADMKSIAPADEYGLVLWSHANGWLGATSPNDDRYRAFGDDRGYHISVQTLAKTLADEYFEFVYFDCCLMGNIETIYELRHITPIMVASPTELSIDGMPYDRNVPLMFDSSLTIEDAMVAAAENTFNYYETNENGFDDGCQIAVYRTAELEALAEVTRPIYETVTVIDPRVSEIQRYNKPGDVGYTYDMDNLMEHFTRVDYPDLLDAWRTQWRKVVAYGAATRNGIGKLIIDRYCGLGSMVIDQPSDITWRGYNTLQWWHDVVSVAPAYSAQSKESIE